MTRFRFQNRLILFVASAAFIALFGCKESGTFEAQDTAGMQWYKGNTHTHTTNSDGDSPPEYVASWYKNHGYNFLVLSDHNFLTDPAAYAYLADSSFMLIAGEEVTSGFEKKPVHVNGLNVSRLVQPQKDSTLVGTLQKNIDAIRDADGAPHINHPNFRWAFDHRALLQLKNDKLLEIYNGHPTVHNWGGGGFPGMEDVWDHLLTAGKHIYGIAVDDAHHFQGEFAANRSNPGRGWVVVRARTFSPAEIIENLEKGLFYASTGVALDDMIVEPSRVELRIRQDQDFRFTTEFMGAGGDVLLRTTENPAIYVLRGGEKYVRAKVTNSGGAFAWTQPVFVQ
ncbi:MAG: PHP domain-containing protein [Deferribacteres bacterium]|nr:PHP domain-containing protein [candidate division KSB1 bacterium]MCB9511143.1 PHP domain-containing protein [Deferribacteres bacterium]